MSSAPINKFLSSSDLLALTAELNLFGSSEIAYVPVTHFAPGTDKDLDSGSSESQESPPEVHENGHIDEPTDLHSNFIDVLTTGVTEETKRDAMVPEDEVGMKLEVKPIYEGRTSYCSCCVVWDDERPVDHDGAALRDLAEKQRARFAVVRRHKKHGKGTWKTHSIVVNSTLIKERLVVLFAEYPGVDAHSLELVFDAPFLPFVHRWAQFREMVDAETDALTRRHLALLIDVLVEETAGLVKTLQNIEKTGFANSDDLNLVYILGETLVRTQGGVISAGVLRDVDRSKISGAEVYMFTVDVVDWNGQECGVARELWIQPEFKGSESLQQLQVLPIRRREDRASVEEKLKARGRVFESLRSVVIGQYNGEATTTTYPSDYPYKPAVTSVVPVHDRIVLDASSYYALQDRVAPQLKPLETLHSNNLSTKKQHRDGTQVDDLDVRMSIQSQRVPFDIIVAGGTASGDENPTPGVLSNMTDDECLLAVGWMKGFAIHTKMWCEFEIPNIQRVEWNTSAMDRLVLDSREKRLLSALIASQHTRQGKGFDDIISGKGRGIIILLSGPPGVGKTLTAESVAESLKRPLYRLGAGDLGSTVETVESRLSEALLRCAVWDAVLLIDEADVFLETRDMFKFARNELVSIFLRLLEYYTGVMILTTNRPTTLDPAFESRIDVSLGYSNLTAQGRSQVLASFLSTLPAEGVDVTEQDVQSVMEKPWNGREIKSAVKTANILAQSEGTKLRKDHLELVLGLREKARSALSDAVVELRPTIDV